MPQREHIVELGFANHHFHGHRTAARKVESIKGFLESFGRFGRKRGAKTLALAGLAHHTCRHDRLAPVTLQSNPTARDVQNAVAILIDIKRVFASEIDRLCRWSVANEQAWWCKDLRMKFPAFERQAMLVLAGFFEPYARVR